MSFEVIIPNAGESVTSANVAQWHKADGEAVAKGDTLLTIETDKVSQEIEAEEAGTLKILIQEGEEVAIGTVVAKIDEADAAAPAADTQAAPEADAAEEETEESAVTTAEAPASTGSGRRRFEQRRHHR